LLAQELNLDFASFNLAIPRLGTTWRTKLLENGDINKDRWKMDTVEGTTAWTKAKIDPEELAQLRKKIQRDFYLRPGYLIRQILGIKTVADFKSILKNGLSILAGKEQ